MVHTSTVCQKAKINVIKKQKMKRMICASYRNRTDDLIITSDALFFESVELNHMLWNSGE